MRRNAKSLSIAALALCALIASGAALVPIHSLRVRTAERTPNAARGSSAKIADSVVQDVGSLPHGSGSTVIYPAYGAPSGWEVARAIGRGSIYVGAGNVTTVIVRQ